MEECYASEGLHKHPKSTRVALHGVLVVTLALQVVFTENAHRYGEHRLCTIDVLEPATHSARGPVVLYCHGGGYVGGAGRGHR